MAMKIATLFLLAVALCHAQADDKPAVEGADATIGRQLLGHNDHNGCRAYYDHAGICWYDCGPKAPKCYKQGVKYYFAIDKYCKYECDYYGHYKKVCHYPQVVVQQGPHCGYVYCKYGQVCCTVPLSWGHASYGPKCYPNVAVQYKCYSHCPSWYLEYKKPQYKPTTWHKPTWHKPTKTWSSKWH